MVNRIAQIIFCVTTFCVVIPCSLSAQSDDWDELMQKLADESSTDDESWEGRIELLNELHEHPIELNTASREELLSLPTITLQQADEIQNYIALFGPMRTLAELRLIKGLSARQREWLRHFVYIDPDIKTKHEYVPREFKNEVTTRFDIPLYKRDGWNIARGIGHRWRYTGEVNKRWDFGLRGSKDSGEEMFTRRCPLWDSWGGHLMIKKWGLVERAVVGDFKASFGEGLVINNSFQFGKMETGLWRTQGGFRPHRSSEECNYLRGGAITIRPTEHLKLSAFYSYRQLDASVAQDNTVSTINTTGLHRTDAEWKHRHTLDAQTTGANITWNNLNWQFGATGVYKHYNHIFSQGTALYRRFYPQGYQFGNVSVDYGFRHSPIYISGETARSFSANGGGWATLNKAAWRFNGTTQLSAVQRFYSYRYNAFLASAYGENGLVQNESGVALLFDAERLGHFSLNTFFDFFYSPWPRYTVDHSSTGLEAMAQLQWHKGEPLSALLRYQLKSKEMNNQCYISHRIRAALTWQTTEQIKTQATLFMHFRNQKFGYAIPLRVDYTSKNECLKASLMAAWFSTPDFATRLFVYEPNLYQVFSMQQMYGRGERCVMTLRWYPPSQRLVLQTKLGLTHYEDRAEISSGPTRIASAWKTDIQLLLRVKF